MEQHKIEVRRLYSEAFKRSVIEEYLARGTSKTEIQRKHGIMFRSAIVTWMKKLGYTETHEKVVRLNLINRIEVAKKSNPTNPGENLEAKIKFLEKQLADERLRSEMLNRMVDLAEKTYKIPVRKNFNTK